MEQVHWQEEFLSLIRQMIVSQNLTYQMVSEKLGISSKTLSRYLIGERTPKEKFASEILETVLFPHLSVQEIIRTYPVFHEVLAHRLIENKVKKSSDQAILHAIEINHELLLKICFNLVNSVQDVIDCFGKIGLRDLERFQRIDLLKIENNKIIHDIKINEINAFIQQKLMIKLMANNFDPKRSGISNNQAVNLVARVDKNKVQIEVMKVLKRAQREIKGLLNAPEYFGDDLLFVSLSSDQVDLDYLQ